jgi:hypothetical protein
MPIVSRQEVGMRCSSRRTLVALVSLSVVLSSGAPAQTLRHGVEFQVNQYTEGAQYAAKVASDGNGDVVVVWTSPNDGNSAGVFGRRFSSAGVASNDFQVNASTAGVQRYPVIAAASSGAFVVSWEAFDGSNLGVFARRFAGAGTPIGGDFQINAHTLLGQRYLAIATAADGDFVVVWQGEDADGGDDDVFARVFSSNGVPQTADLMVNTYTTGVQSFPSVASEPDGDFVVVWQRFNVAYQDVSGRRFSSSGTALGDEFTVNLQTTLHQRYPSVGANADGFVVTWQSNFNSDGSNEGVMARRFSSSGVGLGGELVVNAHSPNSQLRPAIAVEPDGELVVVWASNGQDDNVTYGVFGRLFTRDAIPLNREFQVNAYTTGSQSRAAVAVGGGRFVASWQSLGQDGGNLGVFAHRFVSPIPLDVDGNFVVDPLTDTILALRYAFGFRGSVLITGAVAMNCTRCDAPSIEAYLLDLSN